MFLASHTCRTRAPGSLIRMSRVTRSSSDMGSREYTPGVSITSSVVPRSRASPRVTSTVVPG